MIYDQVIILLDLFKFMEYEIKKKIHITCPHCEKAIETEIEVELEIEEKKKNKDKKKDNGHNTKTSKNKRKFKK